MGTLNIPLAAAVAALLLGLYKWVVYPAFLSPLAKIPNARWHTSFCPLWRYYLKYANVENRTVYELHKKLGPIVRLAPNELSVNCYEGGVKTIYTGGFPKTDFYANRFTNYQHGNMFTMTDNKSHDQRKRMLSSIYAKSVVLASPTIKALTRAVVFDRLLPIFQQSAAASTPVEVHKLNYAYSMDVFLAYQFGLELGSNLVQDAAAREWYLHHFFDGRPWQFWTTELPRLTERLRRVGIRLVPRRCYESKRLLEGWYLAICDRAERLLAEEPGVRAADPGRWPAIYATQRDGFRQADAKARHRVDAASAQPYPRRLEIASEMFDHKAAAHETSGDTLTWLYYEMSRRPGLQARLRAELRGLSPRVEFPLPEEGAELPDFRAVDRLALLDAIVQETLRLWMAVAGPQSRVTPPGGCSLAGYPGIPGGVWVRASAYTLHRNPEVFPDPEEWKPERWLDASPEQLAEMRHWFLAFGSGGRMCIGNHLALHSMKMAVASVYSVFTTEIVDAEGIEQEEGFTAGPKGNKLWLQFRRV